MLKRSAISGSFILFLIIFGCNGNGGAPNSQTGNETPVVQTFEDISTEEAFSLIQMNSDNEDFIILDVRTPQEYNSGHMENAINIDIYSPSFQDSLNILDKDNIYLVYCRTGNRSVNAITIMKELGFTTVYHMIGGIVEWIEEELPIVM